MDDAQRRAAEQAEAERLREVRALIEQTLRDFDVCAHVTLAGRRGRFENFTQVEASWSNLHWEGSAQRGLFLRLRSVAEDYAGDRARQREEREWSVGVVRGLALILGQTALPLLELANEIDGATGALHTPMRRDDPRGH